MNNKSPNLQKREKTQKDSVHSSNTTKLCKWPVTFYVHKVFKKRTDPTAVSHHKSLCGTVDGALIMGSSMGRKPAQTFDMIAFTSLLQLVGKDHPLYCDLPDDKHYLQHCALR